MGAGDSSALLEFRILGPLEVVAAGRRLEVKPAQARVLLALLAGRPLVAGAACDFLHGEVGVFLRDSHTGAESRFRRHPFLNLPFIHSEAERGVEVRVSRAAMQRREHTKPDVVRIEQLRAHEREVGAGRSTVRRPGIPARGGRRRFGILRPRGERQPRLRAVLHQMLAPALWQPGMQV